MSYVNLIYHIVFSTKDREPLIAPAYEAKIHQYIGGIIGKRGGISCAINGTEDHLHIVASVARFAGSIYLSDILGLASSMRRPRLYSYNPHSRVLGIFEIAGSRLFKLHGDILGFAPPVLYLY